MEALQAPLNTEVLYPHWMPQHSQVQYVSDPTEYLPLCSEVTFGLEATDEEGTSDIQYHTLGLFGSIAQRRTSDQGRRQWAETVMNTGGPIWALDWCPTRSAVHPHSQFAAVSAHASPSETHILGKRYVGKGMIQIWSMGILQDSGWPASESADGEESLTQRPVMAMGILHEGAAVWDLKWCPSRASTWDMPEGVLPQPATMVVDGEGEAAEGHTPHEGQLPRLGLLAAAFADGSVKIFSVPHPASLAQGAAPVFVRLTPVADYKLNASNVTSVNWSPHGQHQFLLTGYSDGHIAVWQVGGEGSEARPVMCSRAYKRAVQGVVWDSSNPSVFLSCGQGGYLKFWDTHDPFAPLYSHMAGGGWIVDVKWLGGDYPNIVFSSDDHTIRHFAPHDLTSKIFRYHDAMVWYVDGSYWLNQLASASADGTVKVLPLSPKIMASTKSLYRPKEIVALQVSLTTLSHGPESAPSALEVITLRSLPPEDATAKKAEAVEPAEGEVGVAVREFPDPRVAVQRVNWNPNLPASGWLLSGTTSGLLHGLLLNQTVL